MHTPATTEELAALLRDCTAHRRTVALIGNGTKPGWGNPIATDIALSTTQLTGVLQHSWQDLTCTVAAGTPWSTLQAALAQHHQRVAADPLFPSRATVGGVLAANDCGLLRLRYGGLRDLVLGMTLVLADGTIARTGGRVVKNVAGYDLPKLLTGSFGTLGVIAEATFRLHPLPRHTAAFTVRSSEVAALAGLMAALLRAAMSLERMQLRNGAAGFALDLEFATVPEALAEHEERLRTLAGPLPLEPATGDIFLARERLFAAPDATVFRIASLPSKLAALVDGVAQLDRLPGHAAACVADPAGIVTVRLTAALDATEAVLEDLRDRLVPTGGAVTVLAGAATDRWGPPPAALPLMRAIKQEFDPLHLLNPGRFLAGL